VKANLKSYTKWNKLKFGKPLNNSTFMPILISFSDLVYTMESLTVFWDSVSNEEKIGSNAWKSN
jgi:hypothetical protein